MRTDDDPARFNLDDLPNGVAAPHPNDTAYHQMLQEQHDANREELPQREPGATLPPLPHSTLPCYRNHRTDQGPHLRVDCAEYPLNREELCNDLHGSNQNGIAPLSVHYSDDCDMFAQQIVESTNVGRSAHRPTPFVDPMTVKPGTVFRPAEPLAPAAEREWTESENVGKAAHRSLRNADREWDRIIAEAQREADERADELWTLLAFAAEKRLINAAADVLRLLSS